MSGKLFVVATPIGNLDDLSPRVCQTLTSVSLVAAEDTRHTGRLLMHIGAKKRQIALHDHNESLTVERIIEALNDGKDVALVSDAGTPLLSDPGYRLVNAARQAQIPVVPIPGASALTAALSVAGLPTDRFCFEGFPPAKKPARRARFQELAHEPRTLVFFESVHRVCDSLADMAAAFGGERLGFIGRELTKMHEQCVQAPLSDLAEMLVSGAIAGKGEFVIVVAGAESSPAPSLDVERLLDELADVLPARQAAGIAARLSGQKRNALYQRLLQLRDPDR